MMTKNSCQAGFSLVELIVVAAIIAVSYTAVTLTIANEPTGKARDDVRKSDVNAIADAYVREAIDGNSYKPINGRLPTPPEGGQYQGLLSEDSETYKVCAVLEKGKNINCLEQSDNPKCYCRSSHTDNGGGNGGFNNGGGNQSPNPSPSLSPTPTPTPQDPCANSTGNVDVLAVNKAEYQTNEIVQIRWCLNNPAEYDQQYTSIWLGSREKQAPPNGDVHRNQLQIATNIPMQPGLNTYDWKIPANTLSAYSLEFLVSSNRLYPNYDYSPETFAVFNNYQPQNGTCPNTSGVVNVLSPNGGESFKVGDEINLSWCINDISQFNQVYAQIWLAKKEPGWYSNQLLIADKVKMYKGVNNYSWKIPPGVSSSNNYVLLVTTNSLTINADYSNAVFSINP